MPFKVFDLGLVDFYQAWQFQKEIFTDVKNGYLDPGIVLCQHYPVITLGRLANKKNILVSEDELKTRGIKIYEIERGGDVTYHGPGQLTVYPIFNLNYFKNDLRLFLRYLEDIVLDLLFNLGIKGLRYPGLTGVWIEKQKVASIGIAVKKWITFHGLSLNIKKDDLDNFQLIRPCGLDIEMTSLETALGRDVKINEIKESLMRRFKDTLCVEVQSYQG